MEARQQIRQVMRQRRQALTAQQQETAAQGLVTQISQLAAFQHAQRIALYLVNDGEINTTPLIEHCWQNGVTVYVPVIHPFTKGHLLFLHYHESSIMVTNRYGILEPKLRMPDICPVDQLDIITTPLVAFDNQGQRLGMGGGYYDRTLAPLQANASLVSPSKVMAPLVIGLAHDCQQVDALPTESWDIPLPNIATPSRYWQW